MQKTQTRLVRGHANRNGRPLRETIGTTEMEVPHALVPNTVEAAHTSAAIFRDRRDRRSIRAILRDST